MLKVAISTPLGSNYATILHQIRQLFRTTFHTLFRTILDAIL